ncbi:CocE/NonD family hydrolase [Xinfangfangia sp. CPCC 101601]|uniref:CocE/NonD family hydrolase n=1 Tax=Pseudogemmobacter lacusdianii TaxID=3069608 RepID=A0ABU0W0T8_9RHOB|nr:CocE/NonD family hydrolase [Xinfangfangia sp. CPCC 101601]MDQ2067632.1 CocE/NonD family hydrolase [Xinfangfangia sp. CPCC 101601]
MNEIIVRTDFPRNVREIENIWIPMPDGVRLAARIWLPEDAETDPVPAVLEFLPYRKRDGTVERDALTHPYFAGYGYAGVRVDMRGTGDSEGVCEGEYLKQEQDDAIAIIEWLAAQSWCTGKVGMIGISWGGFNGLQVAARRPAALKAVISLCSTDDRYADDVHYLGGAQMIDNIHWGTTAWAISMTPPDPEIVGEAWREMWEARLNGNGIWMEDWFHHQRRNDFWKHASVCEDFSQIEAAVYAVGGWVDGYTNAVFRLLEGVSAPKKGLVGPWAHKYPHFAMPGPRIGFLQECIRWWDQHLKGIDTGIMDEPELRSWIGEALEPAPGYETWPGRWVADPSWPSPNVSDLTLGLAPGKLSFGPSEAAELTICSPQDHGITAGAWCPYGAVPNQPTDQRAEAGGQLVFDTEVLAEDIDLLGFPELEVKLASDKPVAQLAATLSLVAPDGAATRISFGVLNLTHRHDHLDLAPMQPGVPEVVRMKFRSIGQKLPKGYKLRLGIATAYFATVFPAPEAATFTVHTAESRLILPKRAAAAEAALADFLPAESATPMASTQLIKAAPYERSVTHDTVTGVTTYHTVSDAGRVQHPHTGMIIQQIASETYAVNPTDPNTAVAICTWDKEYARDNGWKVTLSCKATVRALRDVWRMETEFTAKSGDEIVKQESRVREFPRDLN